MTLRNTSYGELRMMWGTAEGESFILRYDDSWLDAWGSEKLSLHLCDGNSEKLICEMRCGKDGGIVNIDNIDVIEGYQGRGIGRSMISYLRTENPGSRITLDTSQKNKEKYGHMGFKVIDEYRLRLIHYLMEMPKENPNSTFWIKPVKK